MSLSIRSNAHAQLALRELGNKNEAAKDLKKLSSGQQVNSAQDNAAGYAMSERMQVQIRSLDQDRENIQNGISMLKIAQGGRKCCRYH